MNRRSFIRATGMGVAAAALVSHGFAAPRERPNILFIMADDHASHAMSCYGSRINQTPNIDRIAAEGVRFDNCFCTNSICAPSRAVILTGKYSHLNGILDNRLEFDGSQQTFPKLLQAAGYETAMIGKWHLKSAPTGFDYWNVLPGQGRYHDPDFIEMGEKSRREGYVTDLTTDYTLDWLANQRDTGRPFMAMCQHKAPHRNWQPDEKHAHMWEDEDLPLPETFDDDYATRSAAAREQEMTILDHLTKNDLKGVDPPDGLSESELKRWKYQRYIKDYLRCVASVDDNVGRILSYLDDSGLAENTLVMYTSDQGFYLGDHGWFDKRFMYEESLRMPLVARLPGSIPAGTVNDDIVLNLDFAPTFLDMANAPVPSDMQGDSMARMLSGRRAKNWRKAMYYHYFEYPGAHMVKRHYGVRTKRHKLMHFYHDIDAWELYDLKLDPNELNNVHADPAYAGVVARLTKQLDRLRRQYADDTMNDVVGQKHPDFERLIAASVTDSDFGYAVESSTAGYAIQKTGRPYTKRVTLRARIQSLRADGTRNGLLCLGSSAKPGDLLKCGVYIGVKEAIVQYGDFGGAEENLVRLPMEMDQSAVLDVTVEADLEAGTVKLTVNDAALEAPMRKDWDAVTHVGYHLNSTETAFSRIEIEGD